MKTCRLKMYLDSMEIKVCSEAAEMVCTRLDCRKGEQIGEELHGRLRCVLCNHSSVTTSR